MKMFAMTCFLVGLILVLTPLAALGGKSITASGEPVTREPSAVSESVPVSDTVQAQDTFRVLITESGKVVEFGALDYVCGAVAGEMPASYNTEALKAQAVASYTYAYLKREKERQNPSADMAGADITDDPNRHQSYLSPDKCKELWGDKYDANAKKIKECVQGVLGQKITYGGQPILAAFHELSAGVTQSAATVWGKDYPYLQSVVSNGDKLSPNFTSTVILTPDEFKAAAQAINGAAFGDDPAGWAINPAAADSGTVTAVTIGGQTIDGGRAREVFGLKSACFGVAFKDGKFTFTVNGIGHGVGMSQYGADYMARQGSDYKEILKHYYTGVEIN